MTAALRVVGVEEFRKLAADLKSAGDKQLRKELYLGLNRSAKPLRELAQKSAADTLPSSGGQIRKRRLVTTGVKVVQGKAYKARRHRTVAGYKRGDSVADRVAASSFRVATRSGSNPSVRLVAREKGGKSVDLSSLDAGRLRHPVYGNRRVWVQQPVPQGWWTKAVTGSDALSAVRTEMLDVIETVAKQLATGGK